MNIENRIDFLSNKKSYCPFESMQAQSVKTTKILYIKRLERICAVARTTCIILQRNERHMCGRCLRYFFKCIITTPSALVMYTPPRCAIIDLFLSINKKGSYFILVNHIYCCLYHTLYCICKSYFNFYIIYLNSS